MSCHLNRKFVRFFGAVTALLLGFLALPQAQVAQAAAQEVNSAHLQLYSYWRISDYRAAEGNLGSRNFRFTVSRSGSLVPSTTITVTLIADTATASEDYSLFSGKNTTTLEFDFGDSQRDVYVYVNGDNIAERDERFFVRISTQSTFSKIEDSDGVGIILNDDALPQVSIGDAEVVEGNAGTTEMVFMLTRSANLYGTDSLTVGTADATATAGEDYTAQPAINVKFLPRQSEVKVSVLVNGDTLGEVDESFQLRVIGTVAFPLQVIKSAGTGIIRNDDHNAFISIGDVEVREGDDRYTSFMHFPITRSGDTSGTTSFTVSTADGTALAGSDYVRVRDLTVTFSPGQTQRSVTVIVLNDQDDEADEQLRLEVVNAPAFPAQVMKAAGTGTILNDDAPTFISIGDAETVETDTLNNAELGSDGSIMSFVITRSGDLTRRVSFEVETYNRSAKAGYDYDFSRDEVTFEPNETEKIVNVWVYGDNEVEPDEEFVLVATYEPGHPVVFTKNSGTGLIRDNDGPNGTIGVVSFSLIDAELDTVLIENFRGGSIDLSALGSARQITIRANTYGSKIGSVQFAIDGVPVNTENSAPYALAGNHQQDYFPWTFELNRIYGLSARAYTEANAQGQQGAARYIEFHFTEELAIPFTAQAAAEPAPQGVHPQPVIPELPKTTPITPREVIDPHGQDDQYTAEQ